MIQIELDRSSLFITTPRRALHAYRSDPWRLASERLDAGSRALHLGPWQVIISKVEAGMRGPCARTGPW